MTYVEKHNMILQTSNISNITSHAALIAFLFIVLYWPYCPQAHISMPGGGNQREDWITNESALCLFHLSGPNGVFLAI